MGALSDEETTWSIRKVTEQKFADCGKRGVCAILYKLQRHGEMPLFVPVKQKEM